MNADELAQKYLRLCLNEALVSSDVDAWLTDLDERRRPILIPSPLGEVRFESKGVRHRIHEWQVVLEWSVRVIRSDEFSFHADIRVMPGPEGAHVGIVLAAIDGAHIETDDWSSSLPESELTPRLIEIYEQAKAAFVENRLRQC